MNLKYNTEKYGSGIETTDAMASEPITYESSPPAIPSNPHQVAARGFAQTFGLLPGMAFLTVATDIMLHSADVASAGLLIPFSIMGGGVLGYITYKSQMKFFGDDDEAAKIKALIVAFLTAIPSPLPYMLFIPAGLVGLVHSWRRKS
jgi:hypothetical protein